MKPLYLLIAALVLVAGCDDSDTAPADDNKPQFTAALLPSNEVPPITSAEQTGSGTAVIQLNLTKDSAGAITAATADFTVEMSGFPSTTAINIAHIHANTAGNNGAIVVNTGLAAGEVTLTNGAGRFTKNGISVSAATAQAILNNPDGHYFNAHSSLHTGGVIRGQLVRR